MTDYEKELDKAQSYGLTVAENVNFKSGVKGLVVGKVIGLSKSLRTEKERYTVLAEEIAHFKINCGNITDQNKTQCRQQERKAHKLMVHELLPFENIIKAIMDLKEEARIDTVAETLGVTEDLLKEAFEIYKAEEGPVAITDTCIVWFEPFRIENAF